MAHGSYRIKLVQYCKRDNVIAAYAAAAHPVEGEVVWYRDKRFIVAAVSHVLRTTVDGNGETNFLDFVEVEVMR